MLHHFKRTANVYWQSESKVIAISLCMLGLQLFNLFVFWAAEVVQTQFLWLIGMHLLTSQS